jgi:hypothetical protein
MSEWINAATTYLTQNTTTAVVNVMSILGFFITVYVMIQIRQIKEYYTARIRLPELRNLLQQYASNLGGFLNDYSNNKNMIILEISKTEPVLQAIKKRLGWSERKRVKEAIKIINDHQNGHNFDEERVRLLYNSLHGISVELEQWENDKRWGN